MKYFIVNLHRPQPENEPIVIEDEPQSNFQPTPKVANKDTNPCGIKGKAPETGNDDNLLLKR